MQTIGLDEKSDVIKEDTVSITFDAYRHDLARSDVDIDPVVVDRNLEAKLPHAGSRRDLDQLLRELLPGSTPEAGAAAVRDRIAGC